MSVDFDPREIYTISHDNHSYLKHIRKREPNGINETHFISAYLSHTHCSTQNFSWFTSSFQYECFIYLDKNLKVYKASQQQLNERVNINSEISYATTKFIPKSTKNRWFLAKSVFRNHESLKNSTSRIRISCEIQIPKS